MDWYRMVWQKYAQFDGRSRRKEYWMFTLINMLIYVVIFAFTFGARGSLLTIAFWIFCFLYGIAAIIPSLAVSVRRLHDTGRSGWWLLISLIPFGGFVLLVFYVLDGTPGPNEYGPDPKAGVAYPGQPITIG
jgi:uncharacterized membrane protein YhaH (DUF805 family)